MTFARVGVIDPPRLADYRAHGGLAGLRAGAGDAPAEAVVAEVTDSGLRGRGGAGFPAGIKWQTVLDGHRRPEVRLLQRRRGRQRHVRRPDADGGRPVHPHRGHDRSPRYAVGATEGYVYLRSEYPDAVATLRRAIDVAVRARLARRATSSAAACASTCDVRVGAGAYICGEETSMLESLEGKRGVVRAKPPLPAIEGLFGQPTVVNNVLTLATVPMVLADGGEAYAALGIGRSRGTQVFQLAGNVAHGGIVERRSASPSASSSRTSAAARASGRPVRAVQVGGPLGRLPAGRRSSTCRWTTRRSPQAGAMVGHGGIVVFDDTVDMAAAGALRDGVLRRGVVRQVHAVPGRRRSAASRSIDRIIAGATTACGEPASLLDDLCELMTDGSLCAMGGLTPMPVRSALEHFPEDFERAGRRHREGARP